MAEIDSTQQHPITEGRIRRLKMRAKALKKSTGVKHSDALDEIARNEGYRHWVHLLAARVDKPENESIEHGGVDGDSE